MSTAVLSGRQTLRRLRLGVIATIGSIALFTAAVLLPGPNHLRLATFLSLLVPAALSSLGFALALHWSGPGRRSELIVYGWSFCGIVLISVAIALNGGARSPLYLLYAEPMLIAACFYPRPAQIAVNVICACAYLVIVAAVRWDLSLSASLMRASIMLMLIFIGSLMTAEKDEAVRESARRANLLGAVAGAARDVNLVEVSRSLEAVVTALGGLGLDWGHVSLVERASGTYRIVQGRNIPDEYTSASPPLTAGIVGAVYAERATVLLDCDASRSYVVPVLEVSKPLTAVIGCPLWVDGELTGVLCGASVKPGGLLPHDIEAFELLGGIASRALEGSQRLQDLAESEALTRHKAYHDDLTGLANRALLGLRLREALTSAPPGGERNVALLLLDLHDFKLVNDAVGHTTADKILVVIAGRLLGCARDCDTVARLSGDEFAVLVPDVGPGNLDRLAQRLLHAVSEPIDVDGHSLSVDASAGIAVRSPTAVTDDEQEAAAIELLSNADVAVYEAKRAGKHSHVLFDQAMADRVRQRLTMGAELPRAIHSGDMKVFYQPIFDLANRSIIGFEALLRWAHPRLGNVPPADFIPLAEENGTILEIGRWVLREACAELQALRNENRAWAGLTMSINLSARQLRDPELLEEVQQTLLETKVPPAQLTLEITESSLLHDAAGSRAKVAALGALGVRIALDDFGTGYSSLSYLRQLQVHCLKIDKSFVDGVEDRQSCTSVRTEPALIRSIAELSGALGLDTVAEGIETETQLAELKQLGCHLGQGYVFSPAVTPDKVRALLGLAHRRPVSLAAADSRPLDAAPRHGAPLAAGAAVTD
ncbi:MAG TPA: EAL domain-containing protein [Acidimicrobiales bacterium]|nr:EAL domain-containing protein [Acidimicrobiales bacterium]